VAIIPVFPGTNSELDTKQALIKAGFEPVEHTFYTPKLGVGSDREEEELAKASRQHFADLLANGQLLVFP
jgi:phosphoribosylformylglycinamidine (FGAM) synthase-like amidotransferase family enzyme